MQQEKRRRVFGASLSVEDGEPVNPCSAIENRMVHEPILSFRNRATVNASPQCMCCSGHVRQDQKRTFPGFR